MAYVVNNFENLPTTILLTTIKQFTDIGVSIEFLNKITEHPVANSGVKRDTYYMIKTDTVIRHPVLDKQYKIFVMLLQRCLIKGYQTIMIKF